MTAGSRLTGKMPWSTRETTPPTENDQMATSESNLNLKGVDVIPEVNLPVISRDKEGKVILAPKIEGVKKNPNDKIDPEGSTILPEVRIS